MVGALALALLLGQSEPVPASMLIWSTSKSQAEAEASVAAFRTASAEWPYFKWDGEWPQIVDSAKVKGLKGGSFVVALGVCFPPEGEPLSKALKVLAPDVTV